VLVSLRDENGKQIVLPGLYVPQSIERIDAPSCPASGAPCSGLGRRRVGAVGFGVTKELLDLSFNHSRRRPCCALFWLSGSRFRLAAQADLSSRIQGGYPGHGAGGVDGERSRRPKRGKCLNVYQPPSGRCGGPGSGRDSLSDGLVVTLSASVPKQGGLKIALADGSRTRPR